MHCGSQDFATPGVREGVFPEGGELTPWVGLRCGLTGVPVVFPNRASFEAFRAGRDAAAWPAASPTGLPPPGPLPGPLLPPEEPRRARWSGGLAALVGFAFIASAAFLFLTAAQVGGSAWLVLGPSGLLALLLGVPFAALARRG